LLGINIFSKAISESRSCKVRDLGRNLKSTGIPKWIESRLQDTIDDLYPTIVEFPTNL
jgi:hypothetical protein